MLTIHRGKMSNFRILEWLLHLNSEDKKMFPRQRMGGSVVQPEGTANVATARHHTTRVQGDWRDCTRQTCDEVRLNTRIEARLKNGGSQMRSWNGIPCSFLCYVPCLGICVYFGSSWEPESCKQAGDVSMCFRKITAVGKCCNVKAASERTW